MKAEYEDHPVFEKPLNKNQKIWKYMSFTKFASLLDKKALFFCRADKLGDPFEGSFSRANISLRPIVYKDTVKTDALKIFSAISKQQIRFFILNCWSMSDCESAALWKIYTNDNEGIALQSTFTRLTQSFNSEAIDKVYIGKVKYIDYEKDWLPEGNLFYPLIHKRKSFQHENELRAVIVKYPETENGQMNIMTGKDVFDVGDYVDVNLQTLVENVYVSPTAPEWFTNLVRSIMEKYGLEKTPRKSDLDNDPVY
jgi:hypothetical protein